MRLFHRTPHGSTILVEGFKDHGDTYFTSGWHEGVWLADMALDANEGAKGDDLLVVDIPEEVITSYEWVQEGSTYREWLVPAALVNGYPIEWASECINCGAELLSRTDGEPCPECGSAT
jgi:hypothetical protein